MKAVLIASGVFLVLSMAVIAQRTAKPKARPVVKKPVTRSTPKPTPTPATVAISTKCTGSGLTDDEVEQLIKLHNKVRGDLKLSDLKWDCKTANFAQAWANKASFQHRTDTDLGENIFVAVDTTESVVTAFTKWMGERGNWNNSNGQCETGKVCTHYTQIVWKSTRLLGCGINRNASGKWRLMLVCNYDPTGNNRSGPAF